MAAEMKRNKEQGRELKAQDLKPGMVVLLTPAKGGAMISIKVSAIDPIRHVGRFYSPLFQFAVEYRYDQRGEFYSALGEGVHVFEFLGEL